ncbi:peptidoglycan-binding protein LysM, partial [Acidithiobacillus ferriphilus]|nr:peptidoglycan-binding protein LysM [Acidithiobacillus ferriphilus]
DYPELLVGQAVIVDQGREAGLSDGNLLRIERTRGDTKNAVTGKSFALPPQKVGEVMVFRVFPTVSYAVITMAKHGILVGDKLVSPRPVTASDSSAGNR